MERIRCKYAAVDLQYGRNMTSFLQQFTGRCDILVDGIEMLVYQGLQSFKLWAGRSIDLEIEGIKKRLLMKYE